MTARRAKKSPRPRRPRGLADLLGAAHAIEDAARVRYGELADQLETHNNPEVAALFRRMAEIEALHAANILALATETATPLAAAGAGVPGRDEGPETAPPAAVHYLMTPHHALSIMLKNEQRAFRFYDAIARTAPSAQVRALARRLAKEEKEHIRLAREWLARFPPPPSDWHEDPDPPGGG